MVALDQEFRMSDALLLIHGGAGVPADAGLLAPQREALRDILLAGQRWLAAGAPAVEVVVQTVALLEDCPWFNAGHGAVLNAEGDCELDAAVMDGSRLQAGAVAGLRRTRNPVRAAEALLKGGSRPLMLIGAAADAYAQAQGCEMVTPGYFETPLRRAQWQAWRAAAQSAPRLDHDGRMGTVGAVARDSSGNLAAATSTGGMTGKAVGRIGDSPLIGAGTYADDRVAVSCTGTGEAFIRLAAAHAVAARLRWGGQGLQAAAASVVQEELPRVGGEGGLIALGRSGDGVWAFNTPGMYRGRVGVQAEPRVAVFAD
jgi:beta-aspartyl-peptidase (threonine type)